MQTFKEMLEALRTPEELESELDAMGRALNRDIIEEMKAWGNKINPEMKKELNKQRIKALNLKLIQGGKA